MPRVVHEGRRTQQRSGLCTACLLICTLTTAQSAATTVTLCNAVVAQSNLTFCVVGVKCSAAVGFAQCVELPACGNPTNAITVQCPISAASSDQQSVVASTTIFADNGRNYGVAYDGAAGSLAILTPSAGFRDVLPAEWTRFVWANLCSECGPVSAYVSDFRKQINTRGPITVGVAVDETEGPPGPPLNARGAFTAAHVPVGQTHGRVVAPIWFPWTPEEYRGAEPLQLLLAPNLTMALLSPGFSPRVFSSRGEVDVVRLLVGTDAAP